MTYHRIGVHVEVKHAPRGLADARGQPLPHVHDGARRPVRWRWLLRLHTAHSHQARPAAPRPVPRADVSSQWQDQALLCRQPLPRVEG